MTKQEAIRLFGSTHGDLAAALGVTRQAVSQMPDVLSVPQADRVIGAAVRLGRLHVMAPAGEVIPAGRLFTSPPLAASGQR